MPKNTEAYYGIFNDSFPPIMDGVTLAVQNYTYWLQKHGKAPCVVTPWNPCNEPQDFKVMKFFSLPIRGRAPYRYGYPKLDPFIWTRLRHTPFKLIHCHCPFSSGRLGVYAKKHHHMPLIGTFHSKYRADLEHWFAKSPWMVRIIMGRILDFFNACDYVWIPQAKVEETIREYGYKGPVTVMDNGNDFADIPVAELDRFRQEARIRQGIPEHRMVLLFVGQHIMEKGVDVIIDTLHRLDGQLDFEMHFIGSGYAEKEMRQMVKGYQLDPRVTFHGVIRDRKLLKDIYASADLFLFPSFYDNAPIVVREAAAMGTPSILLEGSTAAEVIRDGRNGFLAQKSVDDFTSLILSLAKHPDRRHNAGRGARLSLAKSWEEVMVDVEQKYQEILDAHKAQ